MAFLRLLKAAVPKPMLIPAGAIATAGTSIGFGTAAFNSRKKAILTYNSQFDDRSVHVGPSNNGLGLTVAF